MSPAPQAISPITVGGNHFATVSGVVPVSGLLGALSGPWFVEEQTLDISYIRVPNFGSFNESFSLSAPTTTFSVFNTYIQHICVGEYTRRKTYDNYSTSSHIQNQTFIINAHGDDTHGNSYGNVSSFGLSALGPRGTINTLQPWSYRRPWEPTSDVEVSEKGVGSQHYFWNRLDLFGSIDGTTYKDGIWGWGDFSKTLPYNYYANSFHGALDFNVSFDPIQVIQSAYSPNQETQHAIQRYITQVGSDMTYKKFYGIGSGNFTIDPATNLPVRDQGVSQYKTTRHNYTG